MEPRFSLGLGRDHLTEVKGECLKYWSVASVEDEGIGGERALRILG